VDVPQPTARRRSWRLQCSLRALLGLVTLVAVSLGWFLYECQRKQVQAPLIEKYRKGLGFSLAFGDPEDPSTWTWEGVPEPPAWARACLGTRADEYFRNVVGIWCDYSNAGEVLPLAVDIPTLRSVSIEERPWDEPAAHTALAKMTQINDLYFQYCGIRDGHLAMLSGLRNLEKFSLCNSDRGGLSDERPMSDVGMAHLAKLPKLREVEITSTSVTDAGIAHLAKLRFLESLSLGHPSLRGLGTSRITGENLAALQSRDRLRVLRIPGGGITGRGLAQIGQLSALEELSLPSLNVELDAYQALAKLDRLKVLDVKGANIAGEALAYVGRLHNLRMLDLSHTPLGSQDLVHLEGLRHLEELELSYSSGVGDEGLRHVAKLSSLKKLGLRRTAVTTEGMKHLDSLRQLQEVSTGN